MILKSYWALLNYAKRNCKETKNIIIIPPCEINDIFRFVIVLKTEEELIKKVITQIEKQIEVIAAFYHTDEETVFQESALYKLTSKSLLKEKNIQNIIKNAHANIVTVSKDFFVIEKTGYREETEKLYKDLSKYGLLQFVRSGRISVTKEPMRITEILAQNQNHEQLF